VFINKLSASKFKNYSSCQQRFFLESVLGYRFKSPFRATDIGSISHKFLELLAKTKKAHQEGKDCYEDKIFGKIDINIDIQSLIKQVYDYYTINEYTQHNWEPSDFKKVNKYVNTVLEYNNGYWNPLSQNIVDVEKHFELPLQDSWAEIGGSEYLKLNGYIDLVVQVDENTYEIIDYKTGQLKDFHTGEEINHDYLKKDIQVLQYYWAAHHLYGFDKQFFVTMFYIRNEKLFTLELGHEELLQLENRVQNIFSHISANNAPPQSVSWKCKKFCPFATNYSNNPPIKDWKGGVDYHGGSKCNLCDEIYFVTQNEGIETAIQRYKKK